MRLISTQLRPLPLVLALQAIFSLPAYAQFAVAPGEAATGNRTLAGDSTVGRGGSLTTSGSTVTVTVASGTSTLTNAGTISQTGTERTIDSNTGTPNVTINNEIGGLITANGNVVIRMNRAPGSFIINNQGTIAQVGTVTAGGERAIKADANYTSTGNQIINGSANNSNAVISATGNDALRLGSNVTLTNYGNIFSTGIVNTSCPNYLQTPVNRCGADVSAADGVAIENGRSNVAILNYGNITGPRHAVDGGNPVAIAADSNLIGVERLVVTSTGPNGVTFDRTAGGVTTSGVKIVNPVIINYAGGVLTGNNGSGVGLDGHGVVINYGTITGKYAGAGKVYDHEGLGLTTSNGDGDGVDIDGVAYVENSGRIEGLGAGGLDSGGQPNGADGIAAGGGTIINHAGAIIAGATKGILIDDGADGTAISAQRGTSSATGAAAIIANAGSITGGTHAAIGLVGNFNDSISNAATGRIVGGMQTRRLGENNSSAAGAAIQMGAGNDVLTNSGYIEGKNGLAIDMGSGDDTLRLFGGTVVGTIDGGTGTNALQTRGTQTFDAGKLNNFQNITVIDGITSFNYALGTVSNVQVDANSVLRVNGAFSTTGNLSVNGTLAAPADNTFRPTFVAGNYSQGARSVLETSLGTNGVSDTIQVNGNATLADGAGIRPVLKAYVTDGSSYTLVDANTLNANVGALQVVGSSSFLTYTLVRDGNDLKLVARRSASLTSVAPQYGAGFGTGLQSVLSNGSQASINLLNSLETLPNAGALARATSQLAPETNAAALAASFAAQNAFFSAFENRYDTGRDVASNKSGLSGGDNAGNRFWLQGLASVARQKARNGVNGYDLDAQGLAFGYETDLNTRDMLGLAGGYTQAGSDGRDAGRGDDNNLKALHVGAYFSRTEQRYTLDASLALSANRNNSQRAVTIPGFAETLNGKYSGYQVGARFEYGVPFAIDQSWSGRWLMGARLGRLENDGYTESGGITAQTVGSVGANSAQSVLGMEFVNRLSTSSSATLRARYLHEFADTPVIDASFVNGGAGFQIDGVQPGRNALQLGFGYRNVSTSGTAISIGYDLEVRDKYLGHQLAAKASWSF